MDKKKQFQKDYNEIMKNFTDNPLFKSSNSGYSNVFYEEFSVYDKTMISKTTANLV